jgi:phosphoribosyl-dephospho-CoA transferase
VGFELATTQPTVTSTSDLDVLIRVPSPLSREYARALRERLAEVERDLGLHIDAQLETPAGGVALMEWAQDKPRVMARSVCGPRLVDDPWAGSSNGERA